MPDHSASSDLAADNESPTESAAPERSKAWDTYNVVSDTVTGLNVRKSDNKFQAISVLVSMLVLALVGALLAAINPGWQLPWFGGAMIGGFAGMVVGIFFSGVFLMIYRAMRHIKGQHD